jgi:hypothetical protein
MVYRDKEQAELELDMNRRELPQFTWKITEYDLDGPRVYSPIKVCNLCGERLTPNHRC